MDSVKEELADVIVYCVDMLDRLGLDADEIVNAKMKKMKQNILLIKPKKKPQNTTSYKEIEHMDYYCRKVSDLFCSSGPDIVKEMEKIYKDHSASEKKSWEVSLPKLIDVLKNADLGNLYILTEYELPAGGRIDAVLLGDDHDGNHKALVVELKQWSFDGIQYYDDHGFPYIRVNAAEPYLSRHPVSQTKEYVDALNGNLSTIVNKELSVSGCQYLHDFEKRRKDFFTQGLFSEEDTSKMFVKGEEPEFCAYLRSVFSPACDCQAAKDLFIQGEYVMTNMDMEIINMITESPENIPLWSDQNKIIDYIGTLLPRQAKGTLHSRHLIVISGAAGTGKTIVGFRILAEYWKLHSRSDPGSRCKYTLPQSRTIKQVLEGLCGDSAGIRPVFLNHIRSQLDLLVIDEAHRITDFEQTKKAINLAQIVFVLQDDRQRVRGNEIGTQETYEKLARSLKYNFKKFKLDYQKRSGFGSYVDRLDKLLYGTDYSTDVGIGLEVLVCETLQEMEDRMAAYYAVSTSAKYYAPYCWEWKSRNDPRAVDIVIKDNGIIFEKQWNPMFNQYEWYLDSLEKVGCIYTAQGLGFDYVGYIWWDDLVWRTDHWEYHIDKVTRYDSQLRESIKSDQDKELLLNIYRVMLTRAKKGICIWFKDAETREHFRNIVIGE